MDRIKQLKIFLEKEPEDSFLNYALAMELIGLENYSEAKEILEAIRQRDPEYTATYYHLGKLYRMEKNDALAESTYEEGIRLTRAKKEQHKLAELQSALNNLLFDEDDY